MGKTARRKPGPYPPAGLTCAAQGTTVPFLPPKAPPPFARRRRHRKRVTAAVAMTVKLAHQFLSKLMKSILNK